jgi:hypothetical protein
LHARKANVLFVEMRKRGWGVTFEIDHIIPRMHGGKTSIDNLCLCCPSCNRHKSAKTKAVDPITGTEVPLFHPSHERWSEHFSWSKDGTRIVGLTAKGRATVVALKMNRSQMIELRRYWLATGNHPRNFEE